MVKLTEIHVAFATKIFKPNQWSKLKRIKFDSTPFRNLILDYNARGVLMVLRFKNVLGIYYTIYS